MPGSRSTTSYSYYGTTSKGVPPAASLSNLGSDSSLDSEEMSSFSGQLDVITYVATTQPKPGVFIDEISYLLVLYKPISVVSIGVSVSPAAGQDGRVHREIKVYATDMSVSPGVEMTSVVGAADGRIFMCGSRGWLSIRAAISREGRLVWEEGATD